MQGTKKREELKKKKRGEELKLFLEASKLAIGNGGKFLINW